MSKIIYQECAVCGLPKSLNRSPRHKKCANNVPEVKETQTAGLKACNILKRKLTDNQVREIRARLSTLTSMADRMGCSISAIRHILDGQTYRDVA